MTDCIEWLWCRSRSGYGQVRHLGKMEKAHRVAFCMSMGIPISEIKGLVVMHKCDNRGCVNPDHLSLGTQADNILDMVSKGRQRGNCNQYGAMNPNWKHGGKIGNRKAKGEKKA